MDPISIIVTALATGAAAGLKPTAAKVIQDAYAGIKALIQRNIDVNPSLNATTETFFDEALQAARKAETRYRSARSQTLRPLEGVTVSIKDFHSIKGRRTTYGSKAYADFKPTSTAPMASASPTLATPRSMKSRRR